MIISHLQLRISKSTISSDKTQFEIHVYLALAFHILTYPVFEALLLTTAFASRIRTEKIAGRQIPQLSFPRYAGDLLIIEKFSIHIIKDQIDLFRTLFSGFLYYTK